jgi:hypothetical protein
MAERGFVIERFRGVHDAVMHERDWQTAPTLHQSMETIIPLA